MIAEIVDEELTETPRAGNPKAVLAPEERPKVISHEETKVCPDCAESVKYVAKVWRYCGYCWDPAA